MDRKLRIINSAIAALTALLGTYAGGACAQTSGLQAGSPWPKFHADISNSGIGKGTGASGVVKWAFATSKYIAASSPALDANGTVYIGSDDGYFYAVDSSTGAKHWSFYTVNGVDSSPAIGADGTIYFGGNNGLVYALNPNGSAKWSFATLSNVDGSPAIGSDGTVYVGSWDGQLYALDGQTGALEWSFKTYNRIRSCPAIGPDGTVYVGSEDSMLYALDGATGAKKWSFKTPSAIEGSPVIADGSVYVGSYQSYVGDVFYSINATSGKQNWTFTPADTYKSAPVVVNGTVYIAGGAGYVYALNAADGSKKWSSGLFGFLNSSPAMDSAGRLCVADVDGHLMELNSSSGYVIWSITLPAGITSSPAIGADGTIYIGCHDGKLYAISSAVGSATLSAFYATPSSVVGGRSTYGVVQLTNPAGPGGYKVSLSSGNSAAVVPSSFTVPEGKTGVSFLITTSPVSSTQQVTLTASNGSTVVHGTLTVTLPVISNCYASPNSLVGGVGSRLVVQLSGKAATSGAAVSLSSSSKDLTVPTTLIVPAGTTGVSCAISSVPVSGIESVTVTAKLASSSMAATVTLQPAPLSSFYTAPTSIQGGSSVYGVVQISGKAAAAGDTVTISSGNGHVIPPASVLIPAGSTGVSFLIATSKVSANTNVTLTATLGSSTKQAMLTVTPGPLSDFYASPSSLYGGTGTQGIVKLSAPAGTGGVVVALKEGVAAVSMPSSVTVAQGTNSASFAISTQSVAATSTVALVATLGTYSLTASLTLKPIPIKSFYVSPSSVRGGNRTYAVVQLAEKAPSGGVIITLQSDDVHATIQPKAVVAAGLTGISIPVSTTKVTATTLVHLTATVNGQSKQTTLTLTAGSSA